MISVYSAEYFNFNAEFRRTLCFKLFKHIRTKQERLLHSNINWISISVQCLIDKTVIISKHSRGLYKQQMPLTDSHNLHFDRSTNRPWIPLPAFTLREFSAWGNNTTQKCRNVIRDGGRSVCGIWTVGESGLDWELSQRTCSSSQRGRPCCPHNFTHIEQYGLFIRR